MYLYAQIAPGQVVAVGNTHLPSDPYGPTLVKDGEPLDAVLANEADTGSSALRAAARGVVGRGGRRHPAVRHRRLQHAVAPRLDRAHGRSAAAHEVRGRVAGDRGDAGRRVRRHVPRRPPQPDHVAGPHVDLRLPVPAGRRGEVIDRIDYVFAGGDVEVIESAGRRQRGHARRRHRGDAVPSDHVRWCRPSTVDPVEPPPFVSVDDVRVEQGDTFGVRYHAPAAWTPTAWRWCQKAAARRQRHVAAAAGGVVLRPRHVRLGHPAAGAYEVVLLTDGRRRGVAQPILGRRAGASPSVGRPGDRRRG